MRFGEQTVTFANGVRGETLSITSANPRNYHQAISAASAMRPVALDGQLFVPRGGAAKWPLVIIVPGSLGVAPSHVTHAETLVGQGIAAFVLDGLGGRNVTSTVTNQTLLFLAASGYDVLAAWKVLAVRPEIDAARIGAQGHSRGGSAAVLTAAARSLCRCHRRPQCRPRRCARRLPMVRASVSEPRCRQHRASRHHR